MPLAGAIIGLYSGLAAGALANGVGFITGVALGEGRLWEALRQGPAAVLEPILAALRATPWHPEFLGGGVLISLVALWLSGTHDDSEEGLLARRRLKAFSFLGLGALAADDDHRRHQRRD